MSTIIEAANGVYDKLMTESYVNPDLKRAASAANVAPHCQTPCIRMENPVRDTLLFSTEGGFNEGTGDILFGIRKHRKAGQRRF
jgi:hypothetical protein